ncbi:MAG: hypothetical protein ACI4QH_00575 [Candidatus Fimimonas sp.]
MFAFLVERSGDKRNNGKQSKQGNYKPQKLVVAVEEQNKIMMASRRNKNVRNTSGIFCLPKNVIRFNKRANAFATTTRRCKNKNYRKHIVTLAPSTAMRSPSLPEGGNNANAATTQNTHVLNITANPTFSTNQPSHTLQTPNFNKGSFREGAPVCDG